MGVRIRSVVPAAAVAAAFSTALFLTTAAFAQDQEDCRCLGPCAGGVKTEITNLKTPDIIVTMPATKNPNDDGLGEDYARKVLGALFPGTPIVSGNLQDAIAAILARRAALGRKVHVLIDGHGAPGRQQVGVEIIGQPDAGEEANEANFIAQLQGELENLELLGCSVADGKAGQDFMEKLSVGLGGIPVKAFTGTVVLKQDVSGRSFLNTFGEKRVLPGTPGMSQWTTLLLAGLMLASGLWYVSRRREVA